MRFESPIAPSLGRSIRVVEVAQPMLFATTDAFAEVLERLRHCMQVAMLDLTHVGALDATAHRVMSRFGTARQQRNRDPLLMAGKRSPAHQSAGAMDAGCKHFASVSDTLRLAVQQRDERLQDRSLNQPAQFFESPDASPTACFQPWSRRIQQMVSSLRAVRRLIDGVPEIHTPLDSQWVELAGRQLAVFVGPMAKVLARRAAPRCPDLAALYRTLAKEIHGPTERKAFLRLQPTKLLTLINARAPDRPAQRSVALVPSEAGLSLAPEALEQATRDLTPYLGSIAKLLVKRAQAKALDREHLYHLLARQLCASADRHAFLSAARIHPPLGDNER